MNMYHDAERALLDPMETASVDQLRQHQLERLRWSLNHAYANVPLYRQRFAESGAHPDDLKSLEDLAKFPFTGKNDLRDNYPYGMFAVPQQEVVRLHASSGTTGKPTVVGYTQADIDTWANVVARSIRAAVGARATRCMSPMAMGCSPAAWARTTAPSAWAARSSPCPVARLKNKCS